MSIRIGIILALVISTVVSSPLFAKPMIYWVSDPVNPGESVLVSGGDLDKTTAVTLEVADENQKFSSSQKIESVPFKSSKDSVVFAVPANVGEGIYRFTIETPSGLVSGVINAPQIYWMQGDAGASPSSGGWLRIFGRNVGGQNATALIMRPSRQGRQTILSASHFSPWESSFSLPSGLEVGEYSLSLALDQQGAFPIGSIFVTQSISTRVAVRNIKEFGGIGDGKHDDTRAVRMGLASLSNYGGTLIFPRGHYLLTDRVVVPDYVTIQGEGEGLVSLNWPPFKTPPPALLEGGGHFGVNNLTLYADNYDAVIKGGFLSRSDGQEQSDIRIDHVRVRASAYRGHITNEMVDQRYAYAQAAGKPNGAATIKLQGTNITLSNSDIYGSSGAFLLNKVKYAHILNNKIFNGRGWYSITGSEGVIFEANVVIGADLQSTGGGINTMAPSPANSRNIMIEHNQFKLMHGWDREAITSDGPGGFYTGGIAEPANNEFTLSAHPITTWRGAGLFVIGGTGEGEYSRIKDFDKDAVQLERPLPVKPDGSSVITILPMQENYLIISNQFSDVGSASQFFGTAVNGVIADNIAIRTGGIAIRGLVYGKQPQPNWYNQILNNEIEDGNYYDASTDAANIGNSEIRAQGAPFNIHGYNSPLTRGIVIRGNRLDDNATILIDGGSDHDAPGLVDILVENNSIYKTDLGIEISPGVKNSVLVGNRFDDVDMRCSCAANE